jgi:hypothetical protein
VAAFGAAVIATIKKGHHESIKNLALMYGVSFSTIQINLLEDFCLAKKSARWAAQALTKEQKQERVREGEEILDETAMA